MNNPGILPKGTVLQGNQYKYEIVKMLGQGTFGITYLAAVDTRNELGDIRTFMCVKEFFMHEINGRESNTVTCSTKAGLFGKYRQKFVKEAKRLIELSHPNIVKVVESFEANNTVYYSMQFVEGGSLDEMISKNRSLSELETLKIADQIALALEYLHSWNMLHLDLKPSNVMMRGDSPVLIDFGLSKQYDEDGNPESSTSVGGGTPGYSPIEQTTHTDDPHKELPVTMDIYALGATMFKMLTGQRPPQASDIVNDGFPEEELRSKGVSEPTIELIGSMMHFKKKLRPQNVRKVREQFAQLIDTLTAGSNASEKTTFNTPPNPSTEPPKPRQEPPTQPANPTPPIPGGAIPPSGNTGGLLDDEPRKKSYTWLIWLIIGIMVIGGAVAAFILLIQNTSKASSGTNVEDLYSTGDDDEYLKENPVYQDTMMYEVEEAAPDYDYYEYPEPAYYEEPEYYDYNDYAPEESPASDDEYYYYY